MRRLCALFVLILVPLFTHHAGAAVDTLRGTADVADAMIYGYTNCVGELPDEDCHRYNSGGLVWISCGTAGVGMERRSVISIPVFDGTVPDSARLELYCFREGDAVDRRVFIYPLTTPFCEGSELDYGSGGYPDPDSGVTWNHAFLDIGDADSSCWGVAGGDYSIAVACTAIVSDTDAWVGFSGFERMLAWWDSTDMAYGCIVINENAFPSNATHKSFYSSESSSGFGPRAVLYYADEPQAAIRRRRLSTTVLLSD